MFDVSLFLKKASRCQNNVQIYYIQYKGWMRHSSQNPTFTCKKYFYISTSFCGYMVNGKQTAFI